MQLRNMASLRLVFARTREHKAPRYSDDDGMVELVRKECSTTLWRGNCVGWALNRVNQPRVEQRSQAADWRHRLLVSCTSNSLYDLDTETSGFQRDPTRNIRESMYHSHIVLPQRCSLPPLSAVPVIFQRNLL
jgi:hypothetical protein